VRQLVPRIKDHGEFELVGLVDSASGVSSVGWGGGRVTGSGWSFADSGPGEHDLIAAIEASSLLSEMTSNRSLTKKGDNTTKIKWVSFGELLALENEPTKILTSRQAGSGDRVARAACDSRQSDRGPCPRDHADSAPYAGPRFKNQDFS
jgi:hypothetical protein